MAERGIMPWERGGGFVADMFGFLDEDPRIRAMREENYDRTQADVKAQARLENPRWIDTPASVFDELIAPIDRKYESDVEKERRLQREALAARSAFRTVSPGSMIIDPETGAVIADNPTAPRVVRHKVPLAFGGLLGNEVTESANLTEDEFLSQYDALPKAAKESAIGKLLYSRRQPATSQTTNREPFGFIGGDGTNAFSNPFRRGFESVAGTNAPTRRRLKFNAQTGQLE